MLSLINTKLLIIAALVAIGSAVVYQRHESAKATEILLQQQREAEEQKARDEAFRKRVEQDRVRHNSAAAHQGKTWKTYVQ